MNTKQLKHLAEAHFFSGKKLTNDEYNMLKESKYSHLIKKRGKFDEIFESTLPAEEVSYDLPKSYQKRKFNGFNLGVNKKDIDHLIDMVEDQFDLGIDNTSTRKFMNVDVNKLKGYVLKHAEEEGFDKGMLEHIDRIVNKPGVDIYDIMKGLYALGY
jgi:hypothetical protein